MDNDTHYYSVQARAEARAAGAERAGAAAALQLAYWPRAAGGALNIIQPRTAAERRAALEDIEALGGREATAAEVAEHDEALATEWEIEWEIEDVMEDAAYPAGEAP